MQVHHSIKSSCDNDVSSLIESATNYQPTSPIPSLDRTEESLLPTATSEEVEIWLHKYQVQLLSTYLATLSSNSNLNDLLQEIE